MKNKRFYLILCCSWLFMIISSYVVNCNKEGATLPPIHYNIPDPGTQEDKDRLGFLAIKKLHENMDDDRDGQVEVKETKEFMTEELQYQNGMHEREQKFHGTDSLISVEEMWKSWQYSHVYNWTTEEVITWLNDYVKLPQYADYFRRNRIDGQFMPRLAVNENNYYLNVMQIRDSRHKRLLMVKSTDVVLFGPQQKPYNLIKDALMIGALTLSILFCIYLYSKHRQSLDQIKNLMVEFDKLTTSDEIGSNLLNQIKNSLNSTILQDDGHVSTSKLSIFGLKKKSNANESLVNLGASLNSGQTHYHLKDNQMLNEKNSSLVRELNLAKQEAEHLRKERENADGQLKQLELAEKELEKVRAALKQTEARLDLVKYQAPMTLITLLNRTYESEKELIEYKYKLIEKEKEACHDALNKISKRQSGLLGALKIAHSSNLEEINNKIEKLKRELSRFKTEKQEWAKRWSNIDEICQRSESHISNGSDTSSQDLLPFISLENGLILPRKIWHNQFSLSNELTNSSNSINKTISTLFKSNAAPQIGQDDLNKSVSTNGSSSNQVQNNLMPIINSVSTILSKKIYQAKSITSVFPVDEPFSNQTNRYGNANNINKENLKIKTHVDSNTTKVEHDLHNNTKYLNDTNNNSPTTLNYNATNNMTTMPSQTVQFIIDKYKQSPMLATNPNIHNNTNNNNNSSPTYQQPTITKSTNKSSPPQTAQTPTNSPTSIPSPITIANTTITSATTLVAAPMPTIIPTTTATSPTKKIARDSFIHKNDVFTFDDVESVHTHDSLFRNTPQSSFESNDTYKSSVNIGDYKFRNKPRPSAEQHKLISHLITPIFRGVNGSYSNNNAISAGNVPNCSTKNRKLIVRPQSISSADKPNGIGETLNLKKSVTATTPMDGQKNITESVSSLDRKNTFSKHLNSLKRLIRPKSSMLAQSSANNLKEDDSSPTSNSIEEELAQNNARISQSSNRLNLVESNKNNTPNKINSIDLFKVINNNYNSVDDLPKSNSADFLPIQPSGTVFNSASNPSIGAAGMMMSGRKLVLHEEHDNNKENGHLSSKSKVSSKKLFTFKMNSKKKIKTNA